LDDEHTWFRYHHEFQRLLQRLLKKKISPEQIKTIHQRASEWFGKNNLIDEALYHALAAEDVEQAVRLIEQNRKSAVNSDQWYLLDKWLEILPDKIVQQHPELLMARGWVLLHHLQFEAVFQLMDHIESLIGDDTTNESLRGEIALFRGYILYFLGNGAGSIKYIEEALKKIPLSYHEARAQSEVIFALSNQMEGRKEKAFGGLDKLLSNYTSSNEVRKTRLLVTYVFIHIISCDLDQAKLSNQRLREVAENGHAYATAWTNYLEGLIHLIRYELDEAIKFLGKSVSQRYILFQRAAVDSISALMFAYQMKGRSNDANKTLQILREFTASLNDPYYLALADSAEARLAIMQGQSETALSWQGSNALPAMEPAMIWWFEVLSVTHCRALITDGSSTNLEEAQKLLQKFVEINETHHNTFQIIVIILLQVIAYKEQNKIEEALTVLEKAVSLAEPGSIVFPFLELGQPMAELLKQLLPDDINKEFIQTLLYNFEKVKTGNEIVHIPASNDGQNRITEHLTDREIEILTLLSRGLKNREIGDKIFLAPTTIKKHIYNIYQKLDVHSRIEVVTKARENGIIS
jgi:LuxR family maltose regulon positive regulatory protein